MEYTTVNTTGVSTGVIRTEEKKKEAKTDDMKTWWSQDAGVMKPRKERTALEG
jgi:hypothetical protein